MSLEAPYPADTRAKGWRFELDYEKIDQSDTWGLAAEVPLARPCLVMMWLVAWTQEPCGSLPNDESIIRVRCGIPPAVWPKVRELLMRGWWLAEDGRLYHETVTQRVLEMIEYRRKNAERVANFKAAKRKQHDGNALPTGEQQGKNDTGTGTGTNPSLRSGKKVSGYPTEFEIAWAAFPKRPGASKADSLKAWNARIAAGANADAILAGVQRYAAFCVASRTEPKFIKQPATFFGPGEHYLSDWTPSTAPLGSGTIHDRRAATHNGLTQRANHANSDSRTIDAEAHVVG